MSFQSLDAYLPKDLLDSDDDVAQDTHSKNNSFSKIYDDLDEAKTADNSSNSGNNSSSEMCSIFSV